MLHTLHRLPTLTALLGAFALACSGDPSDCEALEGAARDGCLAERVVALAGDPARALAEAQRIQERATRDLALAHVAHEHGLGDCEAITGAVLRQSCLTVARRPHLKIPEPGEPAQATTATPAGPSLEPSQRARVTTAAMACADLEPSLGDACLRREAGGLDPELAWMLCLEVGDARLRGDCLAETASQLAERSQGTLSLEVCEHGTPGLWQDECFFRASEAMPVRGAERAQACERAGRFQDECLRHLIQARAQAGVQRARFGSFAETLGGLERDLEELLPLLGDGVEGQQRLFWYEAFHALLGQAHGRGQLEPVMSLGRAALAGDPRAIWWEDCALQIGMRVWYALQPAPGGMDDFEAAALWLLSHPTGGDPEQAPLLVEIGGGGPAVELAISEVPAPLAPETGCRPDAAARRAILALWSLEPASFPRSRLALGQALQQEALTVRVYALDMAEHKAFFWHRDDELGLAWLGDALAAVERDDPHPALRERAGVLRAGLASRQRPGRWALASEAVCAPEPEPVEAGTVPAAQGP
jgi:hypothetical protein